MQVSTFPHDPALHPPPCASGRHKRHPDKRHPAAARALGARLPRSQPARPPRSRPRALVLPLTRCRLARRGQSERRTASMMALWHAAARRQARRTVRHHLPPPSMPPFLLPCPLSNPSAHHLATPTARRPCLRPSQAGARGPFGLWPSCWRQCAAAHQPACPGRRLSGEAGRRRADFCRTVSGSVHR